MVVLFDVLLDGEHGFTSIGCCCYSRRWVWNSRTKCVVLLQGSEMSAEFH